MVFGSEGVSFEDAIFYDEFNFSYTILNGSAEFERARFLGHANFDDVVFTQEANFHDAYFRKRDTGYGKWDSPPEL